MKPWVRTGLIVTLGAAAIMAAISVATWQALPETGDIPLHWGIDGSPDRWGGRASALLPLILLPCVTLAAGLILAVAPAIDPRKPNLETGRRGYLAIWIAVMLMLVFVHGGISLLMSRGATGETSSGTFLRLIIASAAALIVIVGNYLPKTRSSFFFGIRTPWTLSSDMAWERTHRFAGPVFMLAGGLGILGAFTLSGMWLALQLTALVGGAALVSVIYSYFAWRSAPDREHGTNLTV